MKKENNEQKLSYNQLYNTTANIYNVPFVEGVYQKYCDYCGFDLSGETRCPQCGQGVRTRNCKRYEK